MYVHSLSTGVCSVFSKDLLKLLPCELVSCTYIQKFQEFSRQNKFWETEMLQQCQSRAKIKTVSSTLLTYNYSIEQDLSPFSNIFYLNFPKKTVFLGNEITGMVFSQKICLLIYCHAKLFRASLRAPKYIIFGKRKCYNIKLG